MTDQHSQVVLLVDQQPCRIPIASLLHPSHSPIICAMTKADVISNKRTLW